LNAAPVVYMRFSRQDRLQFAEKGLPDGWLLRAQLKPGDLIEGRYAAAIDATAEQGFCVLEEIPSRWLG
jgi:hypothetical protein